MTLTRNFTFFLIVIIFSVVPGCTGFSESVGTKALTARYTTKLPLVCQLLSSDQLVDELIADSLDAAAIKWSLAREDSSSTTVLWIESKQNHGQTWAYTATFDDGSRHVRKVRATLIAADEVSTANMAVRHDYNFLKTATDLIVENHIPLGSSVDAISKPLNGAVQFVPISPGKVEGQSYLGQRTSYTVWMLLKLKGSLDDRFPSSLKITSMAIEFSI